MLRTEDHEAVEDFTRALRQTPAVAAHREAQAALDRDDAARALLDELRDRQLAFAAAQRAGASADPDVVDGLRACQARVRANEVIMAHLRATNEVKAFLPTVAAEISRALGTDYAKLVAPTSC